MATTSFKMNRHFIATFLTATILLLSSCSKNDDHPSNQASKHSSEVIDKWMLLQLRLMKNNTAIANHALSRQFAYSGIAAIESLRPGLSGQTKWAKWNGLAGLPDYHPSTRYYYPANVNAALASINKAMFPAASAADKAAIDSLEAALKNEFLSTQPAVLVNRSADFGKAVAVAVFNWSESDGYKNANNPYTPPVGDGLWEPTPGAFAPPAAPYWGNNRTIVTGSIQNTQPGPVTPYSTQPGSAFHEMVKQVFDVSHTITDDQKAAAIFWRDIPGLSTPGHWLSILQQVVKKTGSKLDKAALAYALTGAAVSDAAISCWKTKYTYNLVRPITYIRKVMGHSTWSPYIGTPAHPEYSSGHSVLSGAAAAVLKELFGNTGNFTDHTYDYMGLQPRTYSSFTAIAEEAGMSRVWGGIHYLPSVNIGLQQGQAVAANIFYRPFQWPPVGLLNE